VVVEQLERLNAATHVPFAPTSRKLASHMLIHIYEKLTFIL
jgi:hypothetical protein